MTSYVNAFQWTNSAYQGVGQLAFQGNPPTPPNPPTIPPGPPWLGDEWWGDFSTQMFPYIPPPPQGFVPPTPVPQGGNPPTFVQFVYDNGFIGYVLNT